MPESRPVLRRLSWSIPLLVLGGAGWLVAFIATAQAYSTADRLGGAPLLLGVPVWAFGVSLFVVPIVLGAHLTGRGRRAEEDVSRTSRTLAVALVILGSIGWFAAYALSADKVLTILEPTTDLSCNYSLLVQCGANLQSWQGSALGVPNPLIGLAGWAAVVTVGVLLLLGARPSRWFWLVFNAGMAGALAFVIWFISQSVFVLGTLCPWCMVTWAVTIPLFWAVTLENAREGRFGGRVARVLGAAYDWVPLISVASYIVVAIIAQLRLDALGYL